MDVFSFRAYFTDEKSCMLHYKEQRDKVGIVCRRCGGTTHYWLIQKWSYQCKSCKTRISLRSGTIMENSKLPFMIWYKVIMLLSVTKKLFSIKEVQRQVGMRRYESVSTVVYKLRKALAGHNERSSLDKTIEFLLSNK